MKTLIKLSKNLKKDFNKRTFPARVGDKVKIMRGSFSGTTGKIEKVNKKTGRVEIDSAKTKKSNGSEIKFPVHHSNIELIEPDMKDKTREKIITRAGGKYEKPAQKTTREKPKNKPSGKKGE